ncbi:hypothetical protein CBR_g28760 [Chara braunii]|uniref:Retrotransposon gag domain-containing protein n=1 Tax=Chara braunii TaxID=69332 RepID=A0A388L9T3_CHABU|nr:hypothetical protein CBR_g28760 [Chara braunii]|eukprot:GBG79046.1 hypothetical protein CBR_g28760 [Chara braunii]
MGFINHTDLKLDKDVRAAIPEDWKWATFRERLSRAFACDDIFYSIEDLKEMKKEEGETLVAFARRFETASEPLIENGFLGEIERCGIFIGTLPIKRREFVMENTPTKRLSFAQTKALALQTKGLDAKAYLHGVLEKLGKGLPGSHSEKQFGDEDGREFMPPDKSKVSRDSGEWKGGNRDNWKKNNGKTQEVVRGEIWMPGIRFEENRYTEENEGVDILSRASTETDIDIETRTAEEPEQGKFWVSSVRFEEDPDPNDSLTVGVSNIRFESCEEDSDAALVCAKKVSEESDENRADHTNFEFKVSPRGEGPKVIKETWVDQTMTEEMIPIIEECERLKKTGDTHSKGAGDSDISYELTPAFKSVERDISYELDQLSETIEPNVSYELAQLFGTIEHDDDYDLAQLFEASKPDMDYGLTQLFETIDTYEIDVENFLKTTRSRNQAAAKDVEGSGMDQCKSLRKCDVVSIGGEFVEDCLGSQENDNPLAFDQEEEERTVMEVKFLVNTDSPKNMSMRIMKMSGLEELLEAEKPPVDVRRFEDRGLVGTGNSVAGSGIVVEK